MADFLEDNVARKEPEHKVVTATGLEMKMMGEGRKKPRLHFTSYFEAN